MKATIIIFTLLALACCKSKKLPLLGEPVEVSEVVNGKRVQRLEHPVIPDFSFRNQDNKLVTQKDFEGKIYVADFFFTTCPTICPIMKKNMLMVYDRFKDHPDVRILSHTIDPEHDTPRVLKQYADDLGLKGTMWTFVTGERDKIYEIGQKHYLVSAGKDSTAPGGYIHGGSFVLIDKDRHIRGMYDGTSELSTRQLIIDMRSLLKE